MDQFLNIGMNMLGGGGGGGNVLGVLRQFDRNGDGRIGEDGIIKS